MNGLLLFSALACAGSFKAPVVAPRAYAVGNLTINVNLPGYSALISGKSIPTLPTLPLLKISPAPVLSLSQPLRAPKTISEQLAKISGAAQEEEKKDKTDETAASDAAKVFDGSQGQGDGPAGPVYVPPDERQVPEGELPAYLSVADADDRAWLTDVVNVSLGTKTGAKVLDALAGLSSAIGRPIAVVVTELRANNGEYVYDWELVRMAQRYRKLDPFTAAPIFMHELTHVLQLAQKLPVDALEMELEAHIITLRMIRELNLRPKAGSFEDGANRALRKSGVDFVKYVLTSYSTNRALSPGGIQGYVKWLEDKRKKKLSAIKRVEKKIEKELANIEGMRKQGHPEANIAAYELDRLGDLRGFLREHHNALGWMDRDLADLATPEGAERYRRFAERVRRMIRTDQGS